MRVFIYECVSAGDLGTNVPLSLQREGQAMLAAVSADFGRVPDVEVVTLKGAASFAEIAASCDWTLVIAPEFDGWLEKRSETVLRESGRLLGSLPYGIRLTGDKLAMADWWHSLSVSHARTEVRTDAPRIPPPWVLKPRFGAGSQATFLIRQEAEMLSCVRVAYEEWPKGHFVVQQFVPGQHASVAVLIGPEQTIPLLPARQHLSTDGRFRYLGGSLPLPEPLASRAVKLALEAVRGVHGLQGYVGVDLVLGDDRDDYAIEINPRLTTSYIGLRQLCRHNLAELMLRCVSGERIESPAWSAGEVQIRPDDAITPLCSAR